jgi:hypothetical protein
VADHVASTGATTKAARALTAALWTAGLATAAAVALLPVDLVPSYVALVVSGVLLLFCIAVPALLLYVVILTSALAGILRVVDSLSLGDGGVSLSGLRWLLFLALAVVVLAVNLERVRVPGWVMLFLVFAAWAALRFALTPLGVTGAKDVVFYLLPPVLAVYTLFVLRSSPAETGSLVGGALLASVAIPILMYLILIIFGAVEFTSEGPQGLVGPRAIALYLLVVLAVALAVARYADTSTVRTVAAIVAVLATLTVMVTLSRTASVVALAIVLFSRMRPHYPARLVLRFAGVLALAVLLIWNVPAFRQRSFHRVEESFVASLSSFNTMGRAVMWSLTAGNAFNSPVIGWGPGSARLMLVRVRPKGDETEHHPHNEYLQVFHDLGGIGLVLLLAAWGTVVLQRWLSWRRAHDSGDSEASAWNLAALLTAAVVLATSITDNTLHYVFVTGPVFMILAIADHAAGAAAPALEE